MSTLGKVLVVLTMLALPGWMFLAACVAMRRMNENDSIHRLEVEVAELQKPLPDLRTQIASNTYLATTQQVALDNARREFRANLAMAQKTESETKETLERFTAQHAAADLQSQYATRRAEKRLAERTELEKNITLQKAVVAELIADNKAKKDTLAGLEQSFLSTVAESKAMIDQLKSKPAPGATAPARTRLGSLVR